MNRWLVEHDRKGEVYAEYEPTKALIKKTVELFNGSTIFYCCIYHRVDECCLWCVGEPDRRLIEGRLFEDDGDIFHFVIRKKGKKGGKKVRIRHGMEPGDVVSAEPAEILTASETVKIFQAFFANRTIPDEFTAVAKTRLFGALSFPSKD
jgi:hypothetical protein